MELPVFLFDNLEVRDPSAFAAARKHTEADAIQGKKVFDADGFFGQETGIGGLGVGAGTIAHDCFLGFRPGQGGLVVA